MRPSSHLRALVLPHPRARAVLLEEVELAGLEGLARDRFVGVVAVDDAVEVEVAAAHAEARDGVGPVVRVADELDAARHVDLADHVRPGGDRVLGDDLVELLPLAPLAAEDGIVPATKSWSRVRSPQVEAHRARVDDLGALDARQDRLVRRRRLLATQRVEAVHDVGRRDRVAVGEARLRPDAEARPTRSRARRTSTRRAARTSSTARRPTGAPGPRSSRSATPAGRVAAGGERVELVEAGAAVGVAQPQRAAARRVRVDVLEVREAGPGTSARRRRRRRAPSGRWPPWRRRRRQSGVRAGRGHRRGQRSGERRSRNGDGETAAQRIDRVQGECAHVKSRGRWPLMFTCLQLDDGGVLWKAGRRSNPGRQPARATGSSAAATARRCRRRAGSARAPARTSGRTGGSGTAAGRR